MKKYAFSEEIDLIFVFFLSVFTNIRSLAAAEKTTFMGGMIE